MQRVSRDPDIHTHCLQVVRGFGMVRHMESCASNEDVMYGIYSKRLRSRAQIVNRKTGKLHTREPRQAPTTFQDAGHCHQQPDWRMCLGRGCVRRQSNWPQGNTCLPLFFCKLKSKGRVESEGPEEGQGLYYEICCTAFLVTTAAAAAVDVDVALAFCATSDGDWPTWPEDLAPVPPGMSEAEWRLCAAEAMRACANTAFKAGAWEAAARKYTHALSCPQAHASADVRWQRSKSALAHAAKSKVSTGIHVGGCVQLRPCAQSPTQHSGQVHGEQRPARTHALSGEVAAAHKHAHALSCPQAHASTDVRWQLPTSKRKRWYLSPRSLQNSTLKYAEKQQMVVS
eukprot:1157305-Pelagomonas_calceolata.AAC.25